jgi:uncharacterized peroxidase-related enzyme
MSWIKTSSLKANDPKLNKAVEATMKLYPEEYGVHMDLFKSYEPDGEAAIVMAHSMFPEVLEHSFSTFGLLMSPDMPLSRRDHELIAATVSTLNKTHYCRNYHAFFLELVTKDKQLSQTIKDDYRVAALSEREKAMLDYAAKVTLSPSCIQEEDIEKLRKQGFDDKGILQINLIAAWFNYINRVADGLGVGRWHCNLKC